MVLGSPKRDPFLAEIKCRHPDKEYHKFSQNEREVIAEEGHFGSRSPDVLERAYVSIPRPVFEIADSYIVNVDEC